MKHLSAICLFVVTGFLAGLFLTTPALAQTASSSSQTTNITLTVSGNSLALSGYIAPFASIVLTVNGNVITSTVADSNGNFSFGAIAVPKATSTICLDAVDFKKLGQSEACLSVTPINGVISKSKVFLPPTLGVERTNVIVGNSALAFGYGMPGASITVHINNTTGCNVTADDNGYYQCAIIIQKAGDYELFADAVLKGQPSEVQLKRVLVKGIASSNQIAHVTPVSTNLPNFGTLFAIPWWVWLLLVLIAIILILILLRKYHPVFPGIKIPVINLHHAFDFLFRKSKLHHHWMKGVGF